ncbi:MAG: class I SAM-dependent methyltransferase, partial [Verrucomicrobiota bacterium]
MKRATDWAHSCLKDVVRPGDTVVDATAGNGYDSTFLAKQIGPSGCLHIFDIQSSALEATQQRLHRDHPGVTASYYHCGHEEMLNHLSEEEHGIRAITFNLGYLPGALD